MTFKLLILLFSCSQTGEVEMKIIRRLLSKLRIKSDPSVEIANQVQPTEDKDEQQRALMKSNLSDWHPHYRVTPQRSYMSGRGGRR